MVCILDRPNTQAVFDKVKGLFEANVLGGYDVIPESMEWYVVANDHAMHEEFYSIAQQQWKARDPRYACCDDLYAMAAANGVFPRDATFAQGYGRITGTPGSAIPNPIEVLVGSANFISTGTVATIMPPEGFLDFRMAAVAPGTAGNIAATKSTASLATTAVGINSTVTLFGSTFCGGGEAEKCEEFRTRYIDEMAYKPSANNAWILSKLKEWPCVTRVFERGGSCCTISASQIGCGCTACGCNTCTQDLNFYVMFDDTFDCGIPPACVITDLNAWMFGDPVGKGLGQAAVGVCGTIFAPVASIINVSVTGIQCSTATQLEQVKSRIADVFRTAAPSMLFTKRSVELAIAQVVGTGDSFEVEFTDMTGNMAFTPCGDLDPECDILPCLGEINIVGTNVAINPCA